MVVMVKKKKQFEQWNQCKHHSTGLVNILMLINII